MNGLGLKPLAVWKFKGIFCGVKDKANTVKMVFVGFFFFL